MSSPKCRAATQPAADPGQRPPRQLGSGHRRGRRRRRRRHRRRRRQAHHGRRAAAADHPVVWFGAEEVGLFGGLDYRAQHGKEPHYALAESDFGADRVWKVDSKLGKEREAEAKALQAALAPLGIVPGSLDEADGSDIGPLLEAGMPGVTLNQDGTRYFDLHHTPDDTLDKIDPAQLRQNVAAWTAMLAVLSGGIEPEPKPKAKRR